MNIFKLCNNDDILGLVELARTKEWRESMIDFAVNRKDRLEYEVEKISQHDWTIAESWGLDKKQILDFEL